MTIRVVTQNIDFTLRPFGWERIIKKLVKQADVILFQEAKNLHLRGYFDDDWEVYQDTSTSAKAGSAEAWRKSLGKVVDRQLTELTTPDGYKMETRYIAHVDLRIEGKIVRFGSVHFPPKRFNRLWPVSRDSSRVWIRTARRDKVPFVLGGDYNLSVKNHGVARTYRLLTRNVGIDGFIVSRRLRASKAEDLGNNRSDHNPIRIVVRFKKRK